MTEIRQRAKASFLHALSHISFQQKAWPVKKWLPTSKSRWKVCLTNSKIKIRSESSCFKLSKKDSHRCALHIWVLVSDVLKLTAKNTHYNRNLQLKATRFFKVLGFWGFSKGTFKVNYIYIYMIIKQIWNVEDKAMVFMVYFYHF